MKVVLIQCVKKKKRMRCRAKDLYDSTWFGYAWRYAQSRNPDKIFILSAKYGLLDPEAEIEPYEETLKGKRKREIGVWANTVLASLRQQTDIVNDTFIILAGDKYRGHLVSKLPNYTVPMEGLGIGEQLKWLKERCRR